ncbi:MAG: tRNA lysidine(34) synthetase TilS [Gammaproteobacteria bacterium]|nr:MAG: tRNA lysidine(34) synthetase TilS [Gammaproteobacteria bacterium]
MGNASLEFSSMRLAEALARLPPMDRYRVAFSGGADSRALLHALCQLREALAPAGIGAVHVHHGLHPEADAWESDCRRMCAQLDVALDVLRVDAAAGPGESPEAAARRARYQALKELLVVGEAVCTAHHQRDQAETLLLQLVRGAGPAGLAGMPALAPLGRGWLLRPLLDTSPQALRDYLLRHGVAWTEDPGNADQRFDRNYVRHEILPRLEDRWPGVQRTLARAAAHQADSTAIAQALARSDLTAARGPLPGTLSAPALARLPLARARNLLRGWLAERGLPVAAATHVRGILDELVTAPDDAMPIVSWPGTEVRRYRDALYAQAPLPAHDASRAIVWNPGSVLELPHGVLEAAIAEGRGLSVERCANARVEVRFRQGGERIRLAGHRHSTALKKLLQTTAVPPWLRDRVPLIYVDGELAAVAGLAVGNTYAAGGRACGWVVSWTELPGTAA